MKLKCIHTLLFVSLLSIISYSQDLHSSNPDYNLMYTNPAEAGEFLGSFRLQASHRDQYDAFIVDGYKTQIVQLDVPLPINYIKKGWIGYGVSVVNDRSGDLGFRNAGLIGSLAYHLPFDRKNRMILSTGISLGRMTRSFNNADAARFSDTFLGGSSENDIGRLNEFNSTNTEYNFGLKFKHIATRTIRYQLGAAIFHTLETSKQLSKNTFFRRYNFYGILDYKVAKYVILQPRIFTSFSSKFQAINIQTIAKYQFNSEVNLGAGLGFRANDAIQVLLVTNYKGWDFGLSYDITASSARVYNSSQGAFEIGVKKIFIVTQKPHVIRKEICPRI